MKGRRGNAKADSMKVDLLHPRFVKKSLFREEERQFILKQLEERRHHAICLTGMEGIGKATVIYDSLKIFLKRFDEVKTAEQNSVAMMESLSHPDIFVIEGENAAKEKGILIDQVRQMIDFSVLKPSILPFKIMVIDSIDSLNLNAANALLKILEEPTSNTFFLLTCHSKKGTLQTILSRCMIKNCVKLNPVQFYTLVENLAICSNESIMTDLAKISNFNINKAINLLSCNGVQLYYAILHDIIDGSDLTSEKLREIKDSNVNINRILILLTERFFLFATSMSIGLVKKNLQSEQEFALISEFCSVFMPTPNELTLKFNAMIEIIKLSAIYNLGARHLFLTAIHIIRDGKFEKSVYTSNFKHIAIS